MTVAGAALAMREEALRDHEVQMILRPRHGNVQQAPLFFDLGRSAGCKIGGQASIDCIEQKNGRPFLSLGGVDC